MIFVLFSKGSLNLKNQVQFIFLIAKNVFSFSRSNCQLRNTLHKARTFCDKWRAQNMRIITGGISAATGGSNSSGNGNNNANASATTPTETLDSQSGQGRLSRWFSIRRGSTQQYDVGDSSSDAISLANSMKTSQMPQLSEVGNFFK